MLHPALAITRPQQSRNNQASKPRRCRHKRRTWRGQVTTGSGRPARQCRRAQFGPGAAPPRERTGENRMRRDRDQDHLQVIPSQAIKAEQGDGEGAQREHKKANPIEVGIAIGDGRLEEIVRLGDGGLEVNLFVAGPKVTPPVPHERCCRGEQRIIKPVWHTHTHTGLPTYWPIQAPQTGARTHARHTLGALSPHPGRRGWPRWPLPLPQSAPASSPAGGPAQRTRFPAPRSPEALSTSARRREAASGSIKRWGGG